MVTRPACRRRVADSHRVTRGQVALAWVHHQSQRWDLSVLPLPGTTRVSHLDANIAAADLALSADDLERLDAASTSTQR